jgi:hypothetical protein
MGACEVDDPSGAVGEIPGIPGIYPKHSTPLKRAARGGWVGTGSEEKAYDAGSHHAESP